MLWYFKGIFKKCGASKVRHFCSQKTIVINTETGPTGASCSSHLQLIWCTVRFGPDPCIVHRLYAWSPCKVVIHILTAGEQAFEEWDTVYELILRYKDLAAVSAQWILKWIVRLCTLFRHITYQCISVYCLTELVVNIVDKLVIRVVVICNLSWS